MCVSERLEECDVHLFNRGGLWHVSLSLSLSFSPSISLSESPSSTHAHTHTHSHSLSLIVMEYTWNYSASTHYMLTPPFNDWSLSLTFIMLPTHGLPPSLFLTHTLTHSRTFSPSITNSLSLSPSHFVWKSFICDAYPSMSSIYFSKDFKTISPIRLFFAAKPGCKI